MTTSTRDTPVSAAEANRGFSRLLRGVQDGRSYVVTSRGRPVARIVPLDGDEEERARRAAAHAVLMEHLHHQPPLDPPIGRWSREELHDEMIDEPFRSKWLES